MEQGPNPDGNHQPKSAVTRISMKEYFEREMPPKTCVHHECMDVQRFLGCREIGVGCYWKRSKIS